MALWSTFAVLPLVVVALHKQPDYEVYNDNLESSYASYKDQMEMPEGVLAEEQAVRASLVKREEEVAKAPVMFFNDPRVVRGLANSTVMKMLNAPASGPTSANFTDAMVRALKLMIRSKNQSSESVQTAARVESQLWSASKQMVTIVQNTPAGVKDLRARLSQNAEHLEHRQLSSEKQATAVQTAEECKKLEAEIDQRLEHKAVLPSQVQLVSLKSQAAARNATKRSLEATVAIQQYKDAMSEVKRTEEIANDMLSTVTENLEQVSSRLNLIVNNTALFTMADHAQKELAKLQAALESMGQARTKAGRDIRLHLAALSNETAQANSVFKMVDGIDAAFAAAQAAKVVADEIHRSEEALHNVADAQRVAKEAQDKKAQAETNAQVKAASAGLGLPVN